MDIGKAEKAEKLRSHLCLSHPSLNCEFLSFNSQTCEIKKLCSECVNEEQIEYENLFSIPQLTIQKIPSSLIRYLNDPEELIWHHDLSRYHDIKLTRQNLSEIIQGRQRQQQIFLDLFKKFSDNLIVSKQTPQNIEFKQINMSISHYCIENDWSENFSYNIMSLMQEMNITTSSNDFFNLLLSRESLTLDQLSIMAQHIFEYLLKSKRDGKYELILLENKGCGVGDGTIELMRPNQSSYKEVWKGEIVFWQEAIIKRNGKIIYVGPIYHRMACMNPFRSQLDGVKIDLKFRNFEINEYGAYCHNHPLVICLRSELEQEKCSHPYCSQLEKPRMKCQTCQANGKNYFLCESCFERRQIPKGDKL